MSSNAELRLERRGACAWVTLDRPPLNLLTPGLIAELHETFAALGRDASVRAAVIGAAGPHLTGGMQLEVLRELSVSSAREFITRLHDAIRAVHEAPFPTIAMIQGACLGAGFELAMACDLRIAASDAKLGLPEVRVGIPSVIHAALLPVLIGPGRAAEMLLTGESIGAEQALEWGLVNRVVEPAGLQAATEQLLAMLLRCGPRALRLQKELMIRWRNTDLASAIGAGIDAFAGAYASDEPRRVMQAFLEKRPPDFA